MNSLKYKIIYFSLVTTTIVLLSGHSANRAHTRLLSLCDDQFSISIRDNSDEFVHGDSLIQCATSSFSSDSIDGIMIVKMTEPCEPYRGLNPDYWNRVRAVAGDTSSFFHFAYNARSHQINIKSKRFKWSISEICPQQFLAKYKLIDE